MSRLEPPGKLTATQRRQLDDEDELLGAVMEAVPTLAIGTGRVGGAPTPERQLRVA
jgi:hypothetical protein